MDVAVGEIISPLANDRFLTRWKRELLICVLLKQNANTTALKALRCPGVPISPGKISNYFFNINLIKLFLVLEMATLLANGLVSEALHVQRRSGDRKLLETFFDNLLSVSNVNPLLDLTLTEEEGMFLREYLEKTDGLANRLNLHLVYLLQRSKFIDATELIEKVGNEHTNFNLDPLKQITSAFYSTMEKVSRKLTTTTGDGESTGDPLSNNLIRSRCNASNDIYRRCVKTINHATFDVSQSSHGIPFVAFLNLPFLGPPKLGIFEYRQAVSERAQPVVYQESDVNDYGKRKIGERSFLDREEVFEGPLKRRRITDSITGEQAESYVDKRIQMLTRFRNANPRLVKALSRNRTSNRSTPQQICDNFLATPVVTMRTPPQASRENCPGTPHSILKTRSNRNSVSPSRLSEFDDNKSVKSITFAMPTRESSDLRDSSCQELDSSFGETFYSPEKSKNDTFEEEMPQDAEESLPMHRDVLRSSSEETEESESASRDKPVSNFVRKSILSDNFAEYISNSSNDIPSEEKEESSEENISDEQYEEEELPDHSDSMSESDESSLDDTQASNQNEIIEIPDSDDDEDSKMESIDQTDSEGVAESEIIETLDDYESLEIEEVHFSPEPIELEKDDGNLENQESEMVQTQEELEGNLVIEETEPLDEDFNMEPNEQTQKDPEEQEIVETEPVDSLPVAGDSKIESIDQTDSEVVEESEIIQTQEELVEQVIEEVEPVDILPETVEFEKETEQTSTLSDTQSNETFGPEVSAEISIDQSETSQKEEKPKGRRTKRAGSVPGNNYIKLFESFY